MKRAIPGALVSMLVALLSACGGEGPGGVDTIPDASADKQLLAFVTATGILKTFDPKAPTVDPVTIDTNVVQAVPVLGGTYRHSDNSLADPHYPLLLYIKDGKVFRLDLRPDADRTPVQVSSLADACRFTAGFFDYANIENTRVSVRRQEADPDCSSTSDNTSAYFRISASSTTAPLTFDADVFAVDSIYDSSGALTGVLAQAGASNARQLVRYNASLQSPQVITALANGTGVSFSGPEPTGDIFYLRLTTDINPNTCLYRYLAASNQLSSCLHAYANPAGPLGSTTQADSGFIYYADNNLVRKLGHASTAPSNVYNPSGGYVIDDLRLSAARVVIAGSRSTGNPYFVESIPSSTGVTAFLGSGFNPLDIAAVTTNHAYFGDDTAVTATVIRDNGESGGTLANSGWGGFSLPTGRISLGAVDSYRDAYHGVYGTADNSGVVTVRSFNAQTAIDLVTLGTITYATGSTTTAIGRYRLANVSIYRPGTGLSDTDVYFSDTLTANSLRPLATTSGGDDLSAN